MTTQLGTAIAIAAKAFENKLDKGNRPYILHCLHVMNSVQNLGNHAMSCAVMHDLLEDCPEWTIENLVKAGFSQDIIMTLDRLTHRRGVPYMDYIKALAIDPIAKAIKKADIEHNTQVTRIKGLRKKDYDRIEKYHIAYTYLND